MKNHIVIDGNAFYEIDEECMNKLEGRNRKQSGGHEEIPRRDSGRREKKENDPA